MELLLERNIVNLNELDVELDNFADYAQNRNGKVWVKKTLRKWIINKMDAEPDGKTRRGSSRVRPAKLDANSPDWAHAAAKRKDEEGNRIPLYTVHIDDALRDEVRHIIDYLNANPEFDRVGDMEQARNAARNWIRELVAQGSQISEEGGIEVVHTFTDGYFWVKVFGKDALKREGAKMGHCVGSYYKQCMSGAIKVYSLRSRNNDPHITIEVTTKNEVKQAKGHSNKPPLAKYLPKLLEFFSIEKIYAGSGGAYDIERMSPNVRVLRSKRIIDTAYLHGTFDEDLVLDGVQPKKDYGDKGDLVVPKLGDGRALHIEGDLEINTAGAENHRYVFNVNSDDMTIDGHLLLSNRSAYVASGGQAFKLPKKLVVKQNVDISGASIHKWPELMIVHGDFEIGKRMKGELPKVLKVQGTVFIPKRLKKKLVVPKTVNKDQIEWY
jgi:hypothetical protein